MKKITLRKHHKWFGILIAFFMLMFCVSGIILNHREAVSGIDISRKYLPSDYALSKWNGGLLRGTLKYCGEDPDLKGTVFLYGNSGIWSTDSLAGSFSDFNSGFSKGVDSRNIKGMAQTPEGSLWAASQFGLYRYDFSEKKWNKRVLDLEYDEKITDITLGGDTLVVAGRSRLYVSLPPYSDFSAITISAPKGYDGKVSLFRTIWMMHSGEILGITGKLFIDAMAIVLIILCVTGIIYWLLPKRIRRLKQKGKDTVACTKWLKGSLNWHDKLGRYTFFVLMFLSFTGWCLRPPVLIAIASGRISPIPFTEQDSENAWKDKLRVIRYDYDKHDWLLSTSDGMYSMSSLYVAPVPVEKAPPVSVMGLNVLQKDFKGNWLVGSFSGMYIWNRDNSCITDYTTGKVAEETSGPPFGLFAVSGYTDDLLGKDIVVGSGSGTDDIAMPDELASLPMSLWNLSLEVHTGRIYTILGSASLFYIFLSGLFTMWCLYTGYAIRKKNRRQ